MSPLDRAVLAERAAAIERHLARVRDRLPEHASDLVAATDASDAVILHLWQATQIVIDLAVAACVVRGLGTPQNYADAFRRLESAHLIDAELANRLVKAAGFRNIVAHAYGSLDMARVHRAAWSGPADLVAFVGAIDRLLQRRDPD
ncbi:MAG: type VII toxin-antitoxin system HepT family RNase toxin [Vicinamibacterales bacterium]